jgi:hypothetical protein
MKFIRKIGIIIFVAVLIVSILVATQPGLLMRSIQPVIGLFGPDEPFSITQMVEPPDYSLLRYWAAHPDTQDAADLVPAGIPYTDNQGNTLADVFYIHATGYLGRDQWTAAMEDGTATRGNTDFLLANEASIFNSCCDVYAPRYRQASIFAYVGTSMAERDRILSAVYPDVKAAFAYFIEHYNKGRPFIIASHSQGTHHALRLIADVVDGTPLAERMVIAYTLGSTLIPVSNAYFEDLKTIHACQNSSDVNCIVHWDTYGEGGIAKLFASNEASLCTNPLSWQVDEVLAERTLHLGAVPAIGSVSGLSGETLTTNFDYDHLETPMNSYTWARCNAGTLYVEDQNEQDYIKLGKSPDKSYHGVDFMMFHMNIRVNSLERVQAWSASPGRVQ